MNGVLSGLEPEVVFRYFEEISGIPRGTGNEKTISDYLVEFALRYKLEVVQDEVFNVIVKKPATAGYEAVPAFILQAHMDMVCEKNRSTEHDFLKDPIELRLEGDMIYAVNTTLGADNGIGVAYILAILSSKDIPHPSIEALFTVGEEGAMTGAVSLDPECLSGRLLVNLDSEKEGSLLVSSAGGVTAKLIIAAEYETAPDESEAYRLNIGGLRGGHSGADIDKYRGNANKLMGRMLHSLAGKMAYSLKSMDGGMKANAITREAEAVLFIRSAEEQMLQNQVLRWERVFRREYCISDPDVYVRLERAYGSHRSVLTGETKEKVINGLMLAPDGVQSMSMHIRELVESSTNLGIVRTDKREIVLVNEIRSSENSKKHYILSRFRCLAGILGCRLEAGADYPQWQYNPDSALRKLFQQVYRERYGREMEVEAIHAGLECGILSGKLKGLDAVSIGPDVFEAHTPQEHLSVASARNTYGYLLAVLEAAALVKYPVCRQE